MYSLYSVSMTALLFCLPSLVSFSRIVVSILLLQGNVSPAFCLLWAVLSDVLDGFLARSLHAESRFGRYLDPIADKIFAIVFLLYLYRQAPLSLFQIGALFSREISLVLFWLFLLVQGKLSSWQVRSFILGKVMTTLQFLVFFLRMEGIAFPNYVWRILFVVGIGSFFELYYLFKRNLGEKI